MVDDVPFKANINGMDALHKGIEMDFAYKITHNLSLEGLLSLGDWKWTSADTVRFLDDNNNPILDDFGNPVIEHQGYRQEAGENGFTAGEINPVLAAYNLIGSSTGFFAELPAQNGRTSDLFTDSYILN